MIKRRIARYRTLTAACVVAFTLASISSTGVASDESNASRDKPADSPVRGIVRDHNATHDASRRSRDLRAIDGYGNNLQNPEFNSTGSMLLRVMSNDYADYVSQMAGQERPGPRDISNTVANQTESRQNTLGLSDFVWQWGQFLDHDIDLTDGVFPAEVADIPVPAGDPHFDPTGVGGTVMQFNRSTFDASTGTGPDNPREQTNEITGWIDASNVYGSDANRASALRANDGTGRLKVSDGDLLPFNTDALPNAGGSSSNLFLAGDVRANEQAGLTAMHTIFVREHNRIADRIRSRNDELSGDEVYERARRIVAAEMQVITYNEFLPALLGRHAISRYRGYDPAAEPRIMNEFSTAAFRLGHSLLNAQILRLNRRGNEISAGHLPLRNAFFAPDQIIDHGIEPILRGLAAQRCQDLDIYIVDDVRNFLFGSPGQGGFDLASLNIQRGRDHGLPSYNYARVSLGLQRAETFSDISSDPVVQARLAAVYADTDQIDLWVGGLAEDHVRGAIVGELFYVILKMQFEALRDGDRFWYERDLNRRELSRVRDVTLAQIIRRNTRIGRELPDDVFRRAD